MGIKILDDSNVRLPDLPPPTYNTTLNRIVITDLEVKSALQTLKTGKASGPNDLSNRILRELSSELFYPLCCLFNKSLQSGIVPASYKEANVCPIHKKGDRSNVCNCRPISLLNSKIKFWKDLSLKLFIIIFLITIFCLLINLVSFQEIQLKIN